MDKDKEKMEPQAQARGTPITVFRPRLRLGRNPAPKTAIHTRASLRSSGAWMKKDEKLTPELYRVARKKGTEPPFTGKYFNTHEKGMYKCAVCGMELFSSDTKFDSGTGWPSFTKPANLENIELREDKDQGMMRTEVLCKNCGVHLGHVFDDGPEEKGGKRYCINSICLELKKE